MAGRRRHALKGLAKISSYRIALALAVCLALIAGTAVVALKSGYQQPVAQGIESDGTKELMPAAGAPSYNDPNQPAADIKGWGDAPSLQPPGNGEQSAN